MGLFYLTGDLFLLRQPEHIAKLAKSECFMRNFKKGQLAVLTTAVRNRRFGLEVRVVKAVGLRQWSGFLKPVYVWQVLPAKGSPFEIPDAFLQPVPPFYKDLQNLPIDPAASAVKASLRISKKSQNVSYGLTEQQQYNAALISTRVKLAPSIALKEALQPPNEAYDPIANAMKRHPGLTRELAEEMARDFGF